MTERGYEFIVSKYSVLPKTKPFRVTVPSPRALLRKSESSVSCPGLFQQGMV